MTFTKYAHMTTSELIAARKFEDQDWVIEIHHRLEHMQNVLRSRAKEDLDQRLREVGGA